MYLLIHILSFAFCWCIFVCDDTDVYEKDVVDSCVCFVSLLLLFYSIAWQDEGTVIFSLLHVTHWMPSVPLFLFLSRMAFEFTRSKTVPFNSHFHDHVYDLCLGYCQGHSDIKRKEKREVKMKAECLPSFSSNIVNWVVFLTFACTDIGTCLETDLNGAVLSRVDLETPQFH